MIIDERQMAEAIFDQFRFQKCKAGQMVMMNTMWPCLMDKFNPQEKVFFDTVFIGLQLTGYMEYHRESPERIVLTKKGYDYIYNQNLVNKMTRAPWVIPNPVNTDWNKAYHKLWRIIGPIDDAICYIKGSDFYKLVLKQTDELPYSYMAYIEELRKKDLSTSRGDYYKLLIESIEEEKKFDLYGDIQQLIEERLVYSAAMQQGIDLFSFDAPPTSSNISSVVDGTSKEAIIFIHENPLTLPKVTEKNVMDVVMQICTQFKHLIEVQRMSMLLFSEGKPLKEDVVQKLFYIMAISYCKANNIDINRESDPGCGELDFKFSSGAHKKVIIELKLSSSTQLIHGLTTQLPIYMTAEETQDGIYMVMRMSPADDKEIKKVVKEHESIPEGNAKPRLIIIDAVPRPSASKA